MWSIQFDKCIKCGKTVSPHASKGVCQSCYQKEWYDKHRDKMAAYQKIYQRERYYKIHGYYPEQRPKTARKPYFKFDLDLSDKPNTLKKVTLIVMNRCLGNVRGNFEYKSERAKDYIRKHLCTNCRDAYIDNWNNDFKSMNAVICDKCQDGIRSSINKMIERQNDPRLHKIILMNEAYKRALQAELEMRVGKPIYKILREWYVNKKMSANHIEEMLRDNFHIYTTYKTIQRWLNEYGLMRHHVKAMRVRVVTKRMDYSKRKINYNKRDIDYNRIQKIKEDGLRPKRKVMLIRTPDKVRVELEAIAEKSHRTISEVVRDALLLTKKLPLKKRGDRLLYALMHYKNTLASQRIKGKRGQWVILAPQSV